MVDNLELTQGGNNVIEDTGDGRITGQEQEIIDVVNDAIESGDIKVGSDQDLYYLRLVLDFGVDETLPKTLGISYHYFGEKEQFVEALNEALSRMAGEPVEVHSLMELRALIDQLPDQACFEAFLFTALLGANNDSGRTSAQYEIMYANDAEPAVFSNVFQMGYFDAQNVYYMGASGVTNLAQNFMTLVGNRPIQVKTVYCDALPSDVNVEE